MQEDVTSHNLTLIYIYMVPVPRNSEKSMVLGSSSSDSTLSNMVPQTFYAEVTYEHTNEYRSFS